MNGNLLMALRAEALATNLDKLDKHLSRIPDRRKQLEKVVGALQAARNQSKKERNVIEAIKTGLEDILSDHPRLEDPIKEKLSQMLLLLNPVVDDEKVRDNLRDAQASLENLKDRCFRVEESAIGDDLKAALKKNTGDALQKVDELHRNIMATEPGDGPAAASALWDRLRAATSEQNEKLFAEYIEVLGGVALRDSEFDEGISQVADKLLGSYTGNGKAPMAVTIPIRQQACILETFKRIIRVSFPDWTVWALPATALEFWKVMGREERLPAVERKLSAEQKAAIPPEHWECLGDAFAAYTMGPAYALMLISLMLDPRVESDNCRARAVLAMLERMDSHKKGDAPYARIRKRVLLEWNAAREQVGQVPLFLKLDEPETADQTDPPGAPIRFLVEILERTLTQETTAAFNPEIWAQAERWSSLLITNSVDEMQIPQGAELRHVLNAAWLARVDPDRIPEIPDEKLTKAVEALQKKLPKKK